MSENRVPASEEMTCEDMVETDPFDGMTDEELDALVAGSGDGDGSPFGLNSGTDVPEGFRSGFVALVGRPNAGKSTLLNACLGEKVAITSPVAQTTRRRMRGVLNRDDCQIVFVDTPGLHKPQDSLGGELNRSALVELGDVDVVAFLIDATKPIGRGDAWVAERVRNSPAAKILVLTKIDAARPEQVGAQLEAAHALLDFDDEIVVSSVEGFNVDSFCALVASRLPEGPRWFPLGMKTDESDEMLVAEFVREKVLLLTREEVPHAVGVVTDEMRYKKGGSVLAIRATILVERDGQKGIIIGRRGSLIKKIGTAAREDLERIFGCRVFLELEVRVQPNWRSDVREIRRLGYAADE